MILVSVQFMKKKYLDINYFSMYLKIGRLCVNFLQYGN